MRLFLGESSSSLRRRRDRRQTRLRFQPPRLGGVDLIPESSLQRFPHALAFEKERGGVTFRARDRSRLLSGRRQRSLRPPQLLLPFAELRGERVAQRVRRGEVLLRLRPRLARLSRADPRGLGLRRGFVGAIEPRVQVVDALFRLRGDALNLFFGPLVLRLEVPAPRLELADRRGVRVLAPQAGPGGGELDAKLGLASGGVFANQFAIVGYFPGSNAFPRRGSRRLLRPRLRARDPRLGGLEFGGERLDALGQTTVFKNRRTDLLAFPEEPNSLVLELEKPRSSRVVHGATPRGKGSRERAVRQPAHRPVEHVRAPPFVRLRLERRGALLEYVLGPSTERAMKRTLGQPGDDFRSRPLSLLILRPPRLARRRPRLPGRGEPSVGELTRDLAKERPQPLAFSHGGHPRLPGRGEPSVGKLTRDSSKDSL